MINKIGMTVDEAAEYTSIGRNMLRTLIQSGKLPVLYVGRRHIIRVCDLERFMEINKGINISDENAVKSVS